jgi:hypothetical protein
MATQEKEASTKYTWPKFVFVDKDLDLRAKNPTLWSRFDSFFVFNEQDSKRGAGNAEELLYDQFLLDHPKSAWSKTEPDMYTRSELLVALHRIYKKGSLTLKKQRMEARHGGKGRLCRRDFSTCLAAMGGRFKMTNGKRYWVNVGMKRQPEFAGSV